MDDDVWVLTIPAFRWFKLGGATARRPLGGHGCEIVGSSLVTVGGIGVGGVVDAEHNDEQIYCEPSPFRIYDLKELKVRTSHSTSHNQVHSSYHAVPQSNSFWWLVDRYLSTFQLQSTSRRG